SGEHHHPVRMAMDDAHDLWAPPKYREVHGRLVGSRQPIRRFEHLTVDADDDHVALDGELECLLIRALRLDQNAVGAGHARAHVPQGATCDVAVSDDPARGGDLLPKLPLELCQGQRRGHRSPPQIGWFWRQYGRNRRTWLALVAVGEWRHPGTRPAPVSGRPRRSVARHRAKGWGWHRGGGAQ